MKKKINNELKEERCLIMRFENLDDFQITDIDEPERHPGVKLDLTKVKAIVYKAYDTKTQNAKNRYARVTFEGQEECSYDTQCDPAIFFEDLFSLYYRGW